ncbi:hypothetical protein ACFQ1I_42025 [Kitasatospora arboriphila]
MNTRAVGRFCELVGLEHPVVQGPFGGGASSVALAAAVSEAADSARSGPTTCSRTR